MSLNWNLADVKEDATCWEKTGEKDTEGKEKETMRSVTNSLIWATMSVGIGEITEKNWKEFFVRLKAVEGVYGPLLYNGETNKSLLTEKEVFNHIGLSTNVFPKVPTGKFYTALSKNVSTPKKEDA